MAKLQAGYEEALKRERAALKAEYELAVREREDELTRAQDAMKEREGEVARLQGALEKREEEAARHKDALRRQREKTARELDCIVCMEARRATVLLPCRHFSLCAACAARVLRRPCPTCQVLVTELLHTYQP